MAKKTATDIQDIRDDLDSLRVHLADLVSRIPSNVVAMGRQLQEDGTEKALEITDELKKKTIKAAGVALERSEDQLRVLEKTIKANPGKSLLIAFSTGIIANMLLSRRD